VGPLIRCRWPTLGRRTDGDRQLDLTRRVFSGSLPTTIMISTSTKWKRWIHRNETRSRPLPRRVASARLRMSTSPG
jgi:hypothetical protein